MDAFRQTTVRRPMKVLHILNELKYSGAEVMLAAGAGRFARAGIESHILSTGANLGDYAPILKEAGYSITHFPFRKSISFFLSIAKYFRHNRFDIVHIHAERGSFWYACTARLYSVHTVIRSIHNVFAFTGFLRLRRSVQRYIMRSLFGVIFIAVSESVEEVEKSVFRNPCVLIRNWIDQRKFSPANDDREKESARTALGIPTDAMVLVSVGSCQKAKNHGDIIEALVSINKDLHNAFYLHVGTGPLEENEQRRAKERAVDSRVRFAGQLSDVRQALIAGDIFLMPSLFEGLGNAILEAFAVGIPVVAYNAKGIDSVVRNGYNGILCDMTSAQLAAAVLKLHADRTLKRAIVNNGFESLRTTYSMDDSLNKLIHLYAGQR